MTSRVHCARCDAVIREPAGAPVEARQPCPDCGSTARAFHMTGTAHVHPTASVSLVHSWTRQDAYWETNLRWLLVLVALTIALTYRLSFFAAGWEAFGLGLAVAVFLYVVGLPVVTRVREIRKGDTKH